MVTACRRLYGPVCKVHGSSSSTLPLSLHLPMNMHVHRPCSSESITALAHLYLCHVADFYKMI